MPLASLIPNKKQKLKATVRICEEKKLAQMKTKQRRKKSSTEIFTYSLHHFACNYNWHCLTIQCMCSTIRAGVTSALEHAFIQIGSYLGLCTKLWIPSYYASIAPHAAGVYATVFYLEKSRTKNFPSIFSIYTLSYNRLFWICPFCCAV